MPQLNVEEIINNPLIQSYREKITNFLNENPDRRNEALRMTQTYITLAQQHHNKIARMLQSEESPVRLREAVLATIYMERRFSNFIRFFYPERRETYHDYVHELYQYKCEEGGEEIAEEVGEDPEEDTIGEIPPVNIQNDCQNDMNSSGEYISSMSLDELVNGRTVKLSDGHCYSYNDIVNYYNSRRQQGFISPFTRQPFTQQDIQIVIAIIQTLNREQGGRKKSKRKSKK